MMELIKFESEDDGKKGGESFGKEISIFHFINI